jgi:hypothetical protein
VEKTINEHGKEVWVGCTDESAFTADIFYEVDMSKREDDRQFALHTDIGSLTVLDRMTGFGWRDIETGYRDKDGKFWLASGGFDVRYSGAKKLGEAIAWVKQNANNCIGE